MTRGETYPPQLASQESAPRHERHVNHDEVLPLVVSVIQTTGLHGCKFLICISKDREHCVGYAD
jgi:hypothetical protein